MRDATVRSRPGSTTLSATHGFHFRPWQELVPEDLEIGGRNEMEADFKLGEPAQVPVHLVGRGVGTGDVQLALRHLVWQHSPLVRDSRRQRPGPR